MVAIAWLPEKIVMVSDVNEDDALSGVVDDVSESGLEFSHALFRPLAIGDVAAFGNQKYHLAAFVLYGLQREIDVMDLPVRRRRMGCLKTHEFSEAAALIASRKSILHLPGMGPPRRLPERFSQHVRLLNAGELQGCPIGLDKRAVRRHQANELEGLVEDGAVLAFEIVLLFALPQRLLRLACAR